MPGSMNQQGQNQQAGPDNGEAYEAGEDGPDDDGPEELEAGGFDASASAPDEVDQLRRDRQPVEEAPRAQAELHEVPAIPETLKTPEPGDDDVQ